MIGSDELTRAGHVLHDNAGIARQIFSDMARHHTAVSIETATGGGANKHDHGLALEELLGGCRENGGQYKCQTDENIGSIWNWCSHGASFRFLLRNLLNHLAMPTCARGERRWRRVSYRHNPSALGWFVRPSPANRRARRR